MVQSIKELSKQFHKGSQPTLGRLICSNYNAKNMGLAWMKIAKSYIGDVKMNKDTKSAWNNIIAWTYGQKCSLDINKAIGLVGRTGSGKTLTMHILNDFINIDKLQYKRGSDLVNLRFKFESALVIAGDFSSIGQDAIFKYSNFANLCIDDLGAENTNRKHFGDSVNVIQELIEIRHSKGYMTHFTSNLPEEKIAEVYGDRVYSRLIGGVNIIKMNDCDYRLSKNK